MAHNSPTWVSNHVTHTHSTGNEQHCEALGILDLFHEQSSIPTTVSYYLRVAYNTFLYLYQYLV